MVPNQSPIKTIADLRGKRVASAFGSVAHRDVVLWQQAAGLDPRKDVTNINLDILEILNLVQRGGDWGGLDAAMTWDPGAAIIEVKDGARVIKQARVTMVISMPQRLLDQSPQLARRFLSAVRDGWAYYATHQKQANAWYEAEVRKQFGDEILQRVAASEPNMQARNSDEVDLSFSSDDLKSLQTSADWALEMGLATSKMDMSSSIDLRFLERDTRETVG